MAGQNIFTTVGRDAAAWHMRKAMAKFRLGEGGFIKSDLITEVIDPSAVGDQRTYNHQITGGNFSVIGVNQGTKTFTISGDKVSFFFAGTRIEISDSIGNGGLYTVLGAALNFGNTDVEVTENIPSGIADGDMIIDRLPICKGPVEDALHHVTAVVEYDGVTPLQRLEDTTGTGVLTQTLGGTTGTGGINYKTGALNFTFEDYPNIGNSVVVEYKYASVPKAPVASKLQLESEGDPSLHTFEKDFAEANFQSRGLGYGTMRVTIHLSEPEGIDDGTLYGGTPYYFEGGIYDEDDVLLLYFTFDKQKKLGSTTITHTVDLVV